MSVRRGNDIIAGLPIIDGSLNTSSQRPIANAPVALAVNNLNDRIDTIVGGGIYTKTEVDDLLDDKADKATTLSGYNISDGANIDASNITNTGKLNILAMVMPDYSRQETITMPFTAAKYGWVVAHAVNVTTTISVNGVSVAQGNWYNGAWSGNLNCQILVSPGDVVSGAAGTMRFIPCKGN